MVAQPLACAGEQDALMRRKMAVKQLEAKDWASPLCRSNNLRVGRGEGGGQQGGSPPPQLVAWALAWALAWACSSQRRMARRRGEGGRGAGKRGARVVRTPGVGGARQQRRGAGERQEGGCRVDEDEGGGGAIEDGGRGEALREEGEEHEVGEREHCAAEGHEAADAVRVPPEAAGVRRRHAPARRAATQRRSRMACVWSAGLGCAPGRVGC